MIKPLLAELNALEIKDPALSRTSRLALPMMSLFIEHHLKLAHLRTEAPVTDFVSCLSHLELSVDYRVNCKCFLFQILTLKQQESRRAQHTESVFKCSSFLVSNHKWSLVNLLLVGMDKAAV